MINIEREYHTIEFEDGDKLTYIECYNIKNRETLNLFLTSEVPHFATWIQAQFDEVLSGEKECIQWSGNICIYEIRPDITKVYNGLELDNDDVYYGTCCEVDTKELRELIEEVGDKVRDFYKHQ